MLARALLRRSGARAAWPRALSKDCCDDRHLDQLFANNKKCVTQRPFSTHLTPPTLSRRRWVDKKNLEEPEFFKKLAKGAQKAHGGRPGRSAPRGARRSDARRPVAVVPLHRLLRLARASWSAHSACLRARSDAAAAVQPAARACSDARERARAQVAVTEIIGVELGELFVHRNVANLVVSTDLNL
jgi:hypothetical protein